MPDQIGNITVPEIVASGTFPIVPEYPYGRVEPSGRGDPPVRVAATPRSSSGSCWARARGGSPCGATWLNDADRIALRNFWESKYGPYGAFTYNAPNDDGNGTTAYHLPVRQRAAVLGDGRGLGVLFGVTLVEIPASNPRRTRSTRR